jgi:hypothetical protein
MVSRRESLQEALRAWRAAERDVQSSDADSVGVGLVATLRDEYQRIYSANMVEMMGLLREADERRSRSTPSTPAFHSATQDTEVIAADIWEQARRGDRDTPNGRGDDR